MAGCRELLQSLACCALAGAVAAMAFLPVLDLTSEWIDDDLLNFRDSGMMQAPLTTASVLGAVFVPSVIGVYEPVALIIKQLAVSYLGLYPVAIKFASLVVHVANTALSVLFAGRLMAARTLGAPHRWEALLAAALTAAHPLRAEVVAWCSCLPYGLAALFCLLAAHLHLSALERDRGSPELLSVLCVACAVLCKAAALGVGLFLLALDLHLWPRRPELLAGRRWRLLRWHCWRMLAVLMGGLGAANADRVQPLPVQPDWVQRSLRAVYGVWFNLKINLFPQRANNFYPPPPTGMRWDDPFLVLPALAMVAVSAVPALVLLARARGGAASKQAWSGPLLQAWAGWLGYLFLLAPTLGVAGKHLTGSLAHNRFTYIPAFLVFVPALHLLLQQASRRLGRVAVTALAVAVLLPLAWQTWDYAAAWNHSAVLGPRTVAVDPALRPHLANKAVLRAVFFEESAGKVDVAEEVLRRVLQHYPEHPGASRNLGRMLVSQRRAEEARAVLEPHVLSVPEDRRARWWLALALQSLGERPREAAAMRRDAEVGGEVEAVWDRDRMAYEAAEAAFRWR